MPQLIDCTARIRNADRSSYVCGSGNSARNTFRIADRPSLVEHSAKRMRQLLPLHESVPHRCNIRKRIDDRTLYAAANGNRAASGQRSRHAENFIGCEICQYACPRNAKIPPADTESFRAANGDEINLNDVFNLKRLIIGDAAQARSLVGRNFTGNGKLTAEAIAFAANDAELFLSLRDEIFAAADSPFAAVRDAVRYAAAVEKKAQFAFLMPSRTIWDWF